MSRMTALDPVYADVNVSARDYDHLDDDELLVTKIFSTIQGEGPFSGWRCTFLRLAGCNYGSKGLGGRAGCSFCDTDFRFSKGVVWKISDLLSRLREGPTVNEGTLSRLVVVTGGEPLLQKNLVHLIRKAPRTIAFQIETNGTMMLDGLPNWWPVVYVVVSPKVPELPGVETKYARLPKAVEKRADCLKFIISANPESPYYDVPYWAHEFSGLVFLSPIAEYLHGEVSPNDKPPSIWRPGRIDMSATGANHRRAAKLAMQYGFRLSLQQHLFAEIE